MTLPSVVVVLCALAGLAVQRGQASGNSAKPRRHDERLSSHYADRWRPGGVDLDEESSSRSSGSGMSPARTRSALP